MSPERIEKFSVKSKLITPACVTHSQGSAHQYGVFHGGVRVSPPGHSNTPCSCLGGTEAEKYHHRRHYPAPGKSFSRACALNKKCPETLGNWWRKYPCRHGLSGFLQGEKRADIQLNSFGFYTNGSLEVELSLLRLGLQETEEKSSKVRRLTGGFSAQVLESCPRPVPHPWDLWQVP